MSRIRHATAVEVQVPATSANLGPGYDCLGLALGIHDRLIAMATEDPGVRVDIEGEGAASLPRDETHLVAVAAARGFAEMDVPMPGLLLRCANTIPQGRGLGSSAAAIVAGLIIARELVEGGDEVLPDSTILDLATEMEGHPDNVAAALLGGFTTAWLETPGDSAAHTAALVRTVHASIQPVIAIPGSPVATREARKMLSDNVTRESAIFNIARAAALTHALCADPDLLFTATEDRLHQDARTDAYPDAHQVMSAMRSQGYPAVISGAGPTVMVLTDSPDEAQRLLASLCSSDWHIAQVDVDPHGVRAQRRSLGS